MITEKVMQQLAETHGTPLFVIDHDELRSNYTTFKKYLPRVQAYYAVKANPDPAIVKTLFDAGASFDVASMPEFMVVYDIIKKMPEKERQEWIWDRIIYANPISYRYSRCFGMANVLALDHKKHHFGNIGSVVCNSIQCFRNVDYLHIARNIMWVFHHIC